MLLQLLPLAAALSLVSCQFSSLSENTVTGIQRRLRSVVRGGAVATAVRLNFHDCVGGCNGCLNVDNPHNAGLASLVEALEEVYSANSYASVLSRADFWALAGISAVDKGIEQANAACEADDCVVPSSGLVFQWGRKDCSTSPYTTDNVGLPEATLGHDGVIDFFAAEFGFDANETVALMGAHTLGRASSENSGFSGPWVSGETGLFNHAYYQKLTDSSLTWRHRDATSGQETSHWQWNAPGIAFMLDTDVALYRDIQVDEDGRSSCGFSACSPAPSASVVEAFAASNEAWVTAFSVVFTKMLAHGAEDLFELETA